MNIEKMYDNNLIPNNLEIYKSFLTTRAKYNQYNKILISISGGSDSDILLDLLCKFDKSKLMFIFFDTGLEYQATKDHLNYLEQKYDIEIIREKAIKPIPLTCRDYGQPFLSKQVSECIKRLQKHNFKWEDKPYEDLIKEYPNCIHALKWWCNEYGEKSKFNINYNKHLKEFLIENNPTFKISNACCQYAKKDVVKKFIKKYNKNNDIKIDLNVIGVRKAEGGIRSTSYKNCFSDNTGKNKIDDYRPLFWYKDDTKKVYEEYYGIENSKCYTEYGLKRTGCVGCPYGRDYKNELEVIKEYEPKLYRAVTNIFKDSYEYTRKYKEFCENKK